MEFVILGLLKIKSMTAYEISTFISKNLSLICSGSAGSVQAALKKLLKNSSVSVNEFVEGSINKKMYSITDIGSKEFANWISKPMQIEKVKNMELSKLFFLGSASKEEQIKVISDHIEQLKEVQLILEKLAKQFKQGMPIINTPESQFHMYTLEFGRDSAEFQLNWYKNLLETIVIKGDCV